MKNWFIRHPFLATGILICPIAVVVGFASAGFGHGTYVAARIVLPFACELSGSYFGAGIVIALLAFVQWPLYGLLVDKASHKVLGLISVLTVHVALCCWLFTKGSESFQ